MKILFFISAFQFFCHFIVSEPTLFELIYKRYFKNLFEKDLGPTCKPKKSQLASAKVSSSPPPVEPSELSSITFGTPNFPLNHENRPRDRITGVQVSLICLLVQGCIP